LTNSRFASEIFLECLILIFVNIKWLPLSDRPFDLWQ
jgi:hypothetical protein